jgi:5'-deoxynucleotidase YfbR-like HD superfamily hydrolase
MENRLESTADPVLVFAVLKKLTNFLNRSKIVNRAIFSKGCERVETNGEHCWQLAETADLLNVHFKLGLDSLKLYRYAGRHDLVETDGGETPAFPDPLGFFKIFPHCIPETKKERERLALEIIDTEFSVDLPQLPGTIHEYEAKRDRESLFIYSLDKLISSLNISLDNGRTNILLQVTFEKEDALKRPKMLDPFMAKLWDLFSQEMRQRSDLYHQEEESSKEQQIAAK